MSDFHATERFIGGLIVVGVASLLAWNHSQGGESGLIGTGLVLAMVLGGLWAASGLFDLMIGPRFRNQDASMGTSPREPG